MSASNDKPPFLIRQYASSFRKSRADYYLYLAGVLSKGEGKIKLLEIFEKDAIRFDGRARGKLSTFWAERYENNGANLAKAWRGTFPDDEVAIIDVGQNAGGNALIAALRDVGRIAQISDKVKNGVVSTLAAAVFGLLLATVMLTAFPMFASSKIQEMYSFVPTSEWGVKGKFLNGWADGVRNYGLYILAAIVALTSYIGWTINNLVGPVRNWLDRNIVLFTVIRDIKGALFLATMATLTRKRGNLSYTLSASIHQFAQSIRSPWLRWRVEEIADGIERTGGADSSAFETNLLSEDMYWYLCDMQESNGFAQGFEDAGQYVEETVLGKIIKRMGVYKWIMLLFGVACVVGVMSLQTAVIFEMKGVMTNYMSSK